MKEFKRTVFPKLLELASNSSDLSGQVSALSLLALILFKDWELKTKLSETALNSKLIQKLITISETTKETKIKELVSEVFLLLCLIVANDNQNVKKSLQSSDKALIEWTIG